MPDPQPVIIHEADLPDTHLRYAECGSGEPLIIVPATVSLIEDWTPMIQFVAQKYHAYFFEMPGHGGSTPLEGGFSSKRLPDVIASLADHVGFDRFALLGFSFGGVLALRSLKALESRITEVALLSPCVSNRALTRPRIDRAMIAAVVSALRHRIPRKALAAFTGNERAVRFLAWFMCDIGGFETSTDLKARLMTYSESTLDVLAAQVREILSVTEEDLAGPYSLPCFFGMSEFDPLLSYSVTEAFVRKNFANVMIETFDWPYHTPPEPLTFDDYICDYGALLEVDLSAISGIVTRAPKK